MEYILLIRDNSDSENLIYNELARIDLTICPRVDELVEHMGDMYKVSKVSHYLQGITLHVVKSENQEFNFYFT